MSKIHSTLLAAGLAGAAILLLAPSSSSAEEAGLERQLAALQARVAALEDQVTRLQATLRVNHPGPGMEREAQQAFQAVAALLARGDLRAAKPKLAAFLEEYGNTRAGQQARRYQQQVAAVGKTAPAEWPIERWFQGRGQVDLAADDLTMLVFWETWCPHCRREVPKLQRLYEDRRDQGLQMVGLSKLDRGASEESLRSFIAEHRLGFPFAKEDGALSRHFGVSGIPAVAILKDQEVIWQGHPAQVSEVMLDAWLR